MEICIPSSGRPLLQETWRNLPASLKGRASLIVPAAEVSAYRKALPEAPVVSCPVMGIGRTRQWVIETVTRHVVMLDDDLTFAIRRKDDPTKFYNAADEDIERMFDKMEYLFEQENFKHVGVATREGGNRDTAEYKHTSRMLRILGYDAKYLRDMAIRFDRMPVMEDFDVALQLLRMGEPSILINWIVHNQRGSGSSGGCSQYRTMQLQAEAAYMLQKLHPDFVRVVQKTTKTAWGGGERTDVQVSWKAALASYQG